MLVTPTYANNTKNYRINFESSIKINKSKNTLNSVLEKFDRTKLQDSLLESVILNIKPKTNSISTKDFLRINGITYCAYKNRKIHISAGYNNGYYTLETINNFDTDTAKEYIRSSLEYNTRTLGGLFNYINMVKDLKRQDIIQRGLRIHTYEMNTNINEKQREKAATQLSHKIKQKVSPKNLFFIENEAFYYDKYKKTAYCINFDTEESTAVLSPITECKFITDHNNAIGYKVKQWDSYKWDTVEKEYQEQQNPSIKLPEIVNFDNNKEFAEAFRFGNSKISTRMSHKIKDLSEDLFKKIGKTISEAESFQYVKFYDANKNIQNRICYYDPTIGISFVYDSEGKFLYKLDYIKDNDGSITAVSTI